MRPLRITPDAESDLVGIWIYTCEEWGVERADAYLDSLEAGMKQLVQHPSLGADYTHILPGYRRLQIEHHAAFYKLTEQEVLIVRVLHEEMDAPSRLPGIAT
ncbi:type II toxin-antitoxin system RelE/ParE family toxin [Marinihelvus fidelis]|uniref:Toxin n=1 Tax=Marinihelvus fidelis TaxID=2613842 RepID=A0A5N0T3M0_9GAMM|nr:type II toxin-antitoxin system RelE/ParE family toxin [Marinihelvus fidelis]KAA9129665.1 type II toxin-antitoxin system RelE/ParE family toxin [Marinihelvus fidelis]